MQCFFASDLHGSTERYEKLFARIDAERPSAVFLGGDLLPTHLRAWSRGSSRGGFVERFLAGRFGDLKEAMGDDYPAVLLILGNDDGRFEEERVTEAAAQGLWYYVHGSRKPLGDLSIYGYAYVPPTPFLCKDWERYDVSRSVNPGALSPEEGRFSIEVPASDVRDRTIADDLERLVGDDDMSRAVFLFHSPPYSTALDRLDFGGRWAGGDPPDSCVGSVAIRQFIEERQPLLTMHGHIHESPRLTGTWHDRLGRTHMLSAAHDGPELALVRFDPNALEQTTRELL